MGRSSKDSVLRIPPLGFQGTGNGKTLPSITILASEKRALERMRDIIKVTSAAWVCALKDDDNHRPFPLWSSHQHGLNVILPFEYCSHLSPTSKMERRSDDGFLCQITLCAVATMHRHLYRFMLDIPLSHESPVRMSMDTARPFSNSGNQGQ